MKRMIAAATVYVALASSGCKTRDFGRDASASPADATSERLKAPYSTTSDLVLGRSDTPPYGDSGTYLSLGLPLAPARILREDLEQRLGRSLDNRGEAHVTVVTPPEVGALAEVGVTIEDLKAIAARAQIQKARLDAVCVGQGSARKGGKSAQTYYVVVASQDLLSIRKEIQELAVERGARPEAFDAARYFPHITLGFTHGDLHEAQGVIKDTSTCVGPVILNVSKFFPGRLKS